MRDLLAIFNDFKGGDSNAYLELIESKYIKSIINSATKNTLYLEKDEIINEIYIMLNSRKDNLSFKSPQQITSYLKQAIRGLIRNLSDKRAFEIHRECEYNEAHQNTNPFYDEDSHDISDLLEDKPFLRERIMEDKTYEQIATEYGVSLSSAYRTTKKNEEQLRSFINR